MHTISDKVENNIRGAFNFLFSQSAYEIGYFQSTWKLSIEHKEKEFYDSIISSIMQQVSRFADEGSDQPASQYVDLIILLVDSLIFNLYSKNKSSDRARVHQSLYLTSQQSAIMQSQQQLQSIGNYGQLPLEVKTLLRSLERMATSQEFFENLDIIMSYNDNDLAKLQLSHFINTIEYILEKEQSNDDVLDDYIANKGKISKYLIERQKLAEWDEIDEVNKILFSSKLLVIKKLLFVKNDTYNIKEIHMTIGRIYFAAYSKRRTNYKRKQFASLKYQGEEMIYNIFKQYITTQTKRDMLFKDQDEQEPQFSFILNYMQLLYTPVYSEFQQLFDDLLLPNHKLAPPKFFATVQPIIENQFLPFFAQLPPDLLNLLSQFNQTIQDSPHFTDNLQATFSIKNLFISKFLLNPNIKEQFVTQDYNMDNFITIANLFKDLFFTNTNRSYSNLPQYQSMSLKLRTIFEDYITTFDYNVSVDVYSYFITDPLLQNDYSFLYHYYQSNIKVLPSEIKDIHMEEIKNYMPKRIYNKGNDKIEEVKQEKENQNEVQDILKDQSQSDENKSDKSKYLGIDEEIEEKQTERIEKATQTEVQEDEELKNAEKFQPNFNEKSVISDQSITPLEQEEKKDKKQQQFISPEYFGQFEQIQEVKVVEEDPRLKQENQQLKMELEQLKEQHGDLMAQIEFENNQKLKKLEFELAQYKLKNDALENELKLRDMEIDQKSEHIEKLFNEKTELSYQLQKTLDEKELLNKNFQNLHVDYSTIQKPVNLKDLMTEFDSMQIQLQDRRNQMTNLVVKHEIQQQQFLRKINF